jgi:hypothetical protein
MQIPSYAVRPPSSPTGSAPLTDPAQPSLEAVVGTVAALSGKRRFASPDDAPAEQDKVLWSEPVRQALEQHRAERPHGRKDDARAKRRSDPRGDRGGERGGDRGDERGARDERPRGGAGGATEGDGTADPAQGARASTDAFAGLLRRVMAWVTGRPV